MRTDCESVGFSSNLKLHPCFRKLTDKLNGYEPFIARSNRAESTSRVGEIGKHSGLRNQLL